MHRQRHDVKIKRDLYNFLVRNNQNLVCISGLIIKREKYMGLENREGGNYITVLNGKFCQRVKEGTEGAVQRVNKLGNTVWEKFYDDFTAKLLSIKTRDGAYGKSWIFDFRDREEIYHLQLSYSNSYAKAFLKMLPNADVTKEMKLSPSVKEVEGKKKSSLFVNQGGVALKHAYTKDNPNGLPPMTQVTVKGEVVWDDTDQIAFLHDMVMRDIVPKLGVVVEKAEDKKGFDPLVDDFDKTTAGDAF